MAKAKYSYSQNNVEPEHVVFTCPACATVHAINIDPTKDGPCWEFNQDFDNPTFSPSILVRTGKYAPHHNPDEIAEEDKEWYEKHSVQCHSFVRNGKIEFCGDCSHDMKNQTIELPEII